MARLITKILGGCPNGDLRERRAATRCAGTRCQPMTNSSNAREGTRDLLFAVRNLVEAISRGIDDLEDERREMIQGVAEIAIEKLDKAAGSALLATCFLAFKNPLCMTQRAGNKPSLGFPILFRCSVEFPAMPPCILWRSCRSRTRAHRIDLPRSSHLPWPYIVRLSRDFASSHNF